MRLSLRAALRKPPAAGAPRLAVRASRTTRRCRRLPLRATSPTPERVAERGVASSIALQRRTQLSGDWRRGPLTIVELRHDANAAQRIREKDFAGGFHVGRP